MKKTVFPFNLRPALIVVLLGFLTFGCCKKKSPQTAATPAEVPQTASQTTPAASATLQSAAPASGVSDKVAEAQAAMKAKDYAKADAVLSTPQKSLGAMNAEQLAAYNRTRSSLAQQVISAAAAGDPNAKAVLEKMRQDALYHH